MQRGAAFAALIGVLTALALPSAALGQDGYTVTFEDDFTGSALDTSKWSTADSASPPRWCDDNVGSIAGPGTWVSAGNSCHGVTVPSALGSQTVAGGQVSMSSGVSNGFPYFTNAVNPIPASTDWVFEVDFTYDSLGPHGSFIRLVQWPGHTPTPTGNNPPIGSGTALGIGGDTSNGVFVSYPGIASYGLIAANHHVVLEYRNGGYFLLADNTALAEVPSPIRPNSIQIGNPLFAFWGTADWSDLSIQRIRVYQRNCEGKLATVSGSGTGTITGTPGDDVIVGSFGPDVIDGAGGNDVICGSSGNDRIVGGAGNDRLFGGYGADRVFGGNGTGDAAGGDDYLEGGFDNDRLFGEGGNDESHAGDGNDIVSDAAGNDTVNGDAGNDQLSSAAGNDAISGGDGDDPINAGPGTDTCDGGLGIDSDNLGKTKTCESSTAIP